MMNERLQTIPTPANQMVECNYGVLSLYLVLIPGNICTHLKQRQSNLLVSGRPCYLEVERSTRKDRATHIV